MFGGDPFEHMRRQMQEMDNMMNSMMGGDPFGGMFNSMMGGRNNMLTNGNLQQQQHAGNSMLSPFGSFNNNLFGGLMQQMNSLQHHAANDPNSTMFTQSTMISYDGGGQPRVVQSSTRKAGDVRETRHSVQNGNEHKISVEHAIGDRAHCVEKKRDKDGRTRQKQKFRNLDEDEAEEFNKEFKSRITQNLFGRNSSKSNQKAIEGSSSSSKAIRNRGGESSGPIVTIPDDDDDDDDNYNTKGRRNKQSYNNYDSDEDDVEYVSSNHNSGPMIREISDEEADMANPKRRKGVFGKFFRSNDN